MRVAKALGAACLALAVAAIALASTPAGGGPPRSFFGIAPQTPLRPADASRMHAGGIGSVRVPVIWSSVQPTARSEYNWTGLDEAVELTARAHMQLLPFVYGTPSWLGPPTTLPVGNARMRKAWAALLRAAAERYGTHGQFWLEHERGSGDYVPRRPIRVWQIWNEENFFYFARPASPGRYARLLKLSRGALRRADPHAEILAGGLFANPRPLPPRAMKATDFLDRLYRVHGVRADFDGVALHPYTPNIPALRREVEAVRRVIVQHHDARTGLYLTELGWGSQPDTRRVSFEVGLRGQARELRRAYGYLIGARHRLNLKQVFWFSWKDGSGCNFCDSVGLFRRGRGFRAKPAWHAFVRIAR